LGVLLSTPSLHNSDEGVISEAQLPDWVLLKKFEGLEIDIEHWPSFADERIDKFLREQLWYLPQTDTEGQTQEVAGHLLLRLAAATNPRLASWLIEKEGDLFAFRFQSASLDQKLNIAKYLLNPSHVRTIAELEPILGQEVIRRYRLDNSVKKRKKRIRGVTRTGKPTIRIISEPTASKDGTQVGFHFSAIPDVVSERRTFLYRGWAIAPMFVFHLSIKRAFEAQLRYIIEESADKLRLDKRVANLANRLARQMEKIVNIPTQLDLEGEFSGTTIYKRYDLFPLCSWDLLATLRSKGHLAHNENLQLGLFLKALGMSVDEQLDFWYATSVDNVGRTFEQFDRKVGYLIRHLYGLVGQGADYRPPRCKTIFTRYYCPYMKRAPEDIEALVREYVDTVALRGNEGTLTRLREFSATRRANSACSLVFSLKFGRKPPIWHPVQYVQEATTALNALSEKKEAQEATDKIDASENE